MWRSELEPGILQCSVHPDTFILLRGTCSLYVIVCFHPARSWFVFFRKRDGLGSTPEPSVRRTFSESVPFFPEWIRKVKKKKKKHFDTIPQPLWVLLWNHWQVLIYSLEAKSNWKHWKVIKRVIIALWVVKYRPFSYLHMYMLAF